MRQRSKAVSTVLAICLAVGALALVALVDISRWPLRLRLGVRGSAQPPATQVPAPAPRAQEPAPPSATRAPAPCPTAQGWGSINPDGLGPSIWWLSYAPNGCEIAFVGTGNGDRAAHIWIVTADGRHLRKLPTDIGPEISSRLAWSPDGSRIAFASRSIDGNTDIWVVHRDGSGAVRLTTEPGEDDKPDWTPDGSQIAFVALRPGALSRDLWIMNADGTNHRRVLGLRGSVDAPAFSPDGRRLVFSYSFFTSDQTVPLGQRHRVRLMVVNVDGSEPRDLTTGEFVDTMPDWGPRGIVFARIIRDRFTLWIIQPDGSGLQALSDISGMNPAWSPDGTKVAFRDEWTIQVFNSLDGTIQPLTLPRGLLVTIYVKPGSPNTINPKTDGRIPVAILSTPWFDPVREIDQTSITFGPSGDERSLISCAAYESNGDGVPDLLCYFDVAAQFSPAHTDGILRAKGVNETLFEGRDTVSVLSTP